MPQGKALNAVACCVSLFKRRQPNEEFVVASSFNTVAVTPSQIHDEDGEKSVPPPSDQRKPLLSAIDDQNTPTNWLSVFPCTSKSIVSSLLSFFPSQCQTTAKRSGREDFQNARQKKGKLEVKDSKTLVIWWIDWLYDWSTDLLLMWWIDWVTSD